MAVFIEATTDPFAIARQQAVEGYASQFRNEANIRRPTRGYQIKEKTYAIIRVMKSDGSFLEVLDAAGEHIVQEENKAYTTFYSNFFVQSVQEERQEKKQIVETFGDDYIFFFGESPRLLQVSGMLLNTADFNWRSEWWENYDRFFRGTKLVEQGARMFLIFDDILIEGYILTAQAQEASEIPQAIPFSFQMFITGYTNMSLIADPHFPGTNGVYGTAVSYTDEAQLQERGVADRQMAGESLGATRDATGLRSNPFNKDEEATGGRGRLLADSVRAGIVSAADPATSSRVQRASAATSADKMVFQPRPSGQRGLISDNQDEFVERGYHPADTPLMDMPSDDEWLQASQAMDNGVTGAVTEDENGNVVDTTEREYWDALGRGGRARDEMNRQGGDRNSGRGIRNELGSSDLGDHSVPGDTATGSRSVPFGMVPVAGALA